MNSINNHSQLAREIDETSNVLLDSPVAPGNCYIASTEAGDVGITIVDEKAADAQISPVKKRLELGKVESVVRLLENWLEIPLDFAPVNQQMSAPQIFTVEDPARPSVKIGIHLPVQAWQQVSEPVSMLENSPFTINWTGYYAKVTLDLLKLSDTDTKAVRTGATVLLASSFNPNWNPRLSVPGLAAAVVGEVELPGLHWGSEGVFNHIEYASGDFCGEIIGEVVSFCTVNAKLCMRQQWAELQEFLTNRLREGSWTLQFSSENKATGDLLPIANGLGLHVRQINKCH